MPELPEVETVRRGLEKPLKGQAIRSVGLRRKDLRIPFPKDLGQRLTGRVIESIGRKGKYLLFHLDSEDVVIAHLGMSGNFLLNKKAPEIFGKHDHLVMQLDDYHLTFNDPRRFGLITLAKAHELQKHKLLAAMGPDPFEKAFSPAYLKEALKRRKGPIKPVLMDQTLVAGVGNIYASEALYLAKVAPGKPAHKVAAAAEALVADVRKVLQAAIESGGSSLRDFMQVSGEGGYFQHRFNVYDRKGEPCRRCKTPIKEIRQAGRSTFFCPSCQK